MEFKADITDTATTSTELPRDEIPTISDQELEHTLSLASKLDITDTATTTTELPPDEMPIIPAPKDEGFKFEWRKDFIFEPHMRIPRLDVDSTEELEDWIISAMLNCSLTLLPRDQVNILISTLFNSYMRDKVIKPIISAAIDAPANWDRAQGRANGATIIHNAYRQARWKFAVCLSNKGHISEGDSRKWNDKFSKYIPGFRIDPKSILDLYDGFACYYDENKVKDLLLDLKKNLSETPELVAIVDQAPGQGMLGLRLILRACNNHSDFNWKIIADMFKGEFEVVTKAAEALIADPLLGFKSASRDYCNNKYKSIGFFAKTYLIEVDGDDSLRKYQGFPRHNAIRNPELIRLVKNSNLHLEERSGDLPEMEVLLKAHQFIDSLRRDDLESNFYSIRK